MSLKETVTTERNVDPRIADLVYFFRYVICKLDDNVTIAALKKMTDQDILKFAHSFWDRQHGED